MSNTREVPLHTAIKKLLHTFKMKQIDEGGICFGITFSGLVAALTPRQPGDNSPFIGDMSTFVRRLSFIMSIYQDETIPQKIENIKEKVKNKKTLTDEEKMYLEIPAFLQRVDVFFQPQEYAKKDQTLFQQRKVPYTQQAEAVFPLLQPE